VPELVIVTVSDSVRRTAAANDSLLGPTAVGAIGGTGNVSFST